MVQEDLLVPVPYHLLGFEVGDVTLVKLLHFDIRSHCRPDRHDALGKHTGFLKISEIILVTK